MSKKQTIKLSAIFVEKLFLIGIVLLLTLLAVNYIFVSNILKSQAKAVDHARIDLKVAEDSVAQTKKMQAFLAKNQDLIERSSRASGNPSSGLSSQDQIIQDLQNYSKLIGIEISGYELSTSASSTSSSTTPSSTATPSSTSSSTSTPTPSSTSSTTKAPPAGVEVINATITFKDAPSNEKLLTLLSMMEMGVSRMEVNDISMSGSDTGEGDKTSNLSIKIYVHQEAKR